MRRIYQQSKRLNFRSNENDVVAREFRYNSVFPTFWCSDKVDAVICVRNMGNSESVSHWSSTSFCLQKTTMSQQQNTKPHGIRWYRTVPYVYRKYDQLPQILAETPKNAHDKFPKQTLTMLESDLDIHAPNSVSNCAGNIKHCLESYGFQDVCTHSKQNIISFCVQKEMVERFQEEWHTKISNTDTFSHSISLPFHLSRIAHSSEMLPAADGLIYSCMPSVCWKRSFKDRTGDLRAKRSIYFTHIWRCSLLRQSCVKYKHELYERTRPARNDEKLIWLKCCFTFTETVGF